MKVLMISGYNVECGIATYTTHLAEELINKGIDVFIAAEDYINGVKNYKYSNIPYIRCWKRGDNNYKRLKSVIKYEKPDVVHVQFEYGYFYPFEKEFISLLKFIKSKHIKLVITYHSLVNKGRGLDCAFKFAKYADLVIQHDIEGIKEMKKYVNIPCKHILHGAIRPQYPLISKKQARYELGLSKNEFVILSTGFINPNKKIVENIWAVKEIMQKYNLNPTYIVAGKAIILDDNQSNKHYLHKINDLIKRLGTKTIILNHFFTEKAIGKYISAADVLLFNSGYTYPSSSGNITRVRTYLKPSISADSRLQSDLLPSESLRFNYDSQRELVNAIITAMKCPDVLHRQIINLYKNSEKYYWDNIAYEHISAYEGLW